MCICIYILNNKLYDIHELNEFAKVCSKFIDYSISFFFFFLDKLR